MKKYTFNRSEYTQEQWFDVLKSHKANPHSLPVSFSRCKNQLGFIKEDFQELLSHKAKDFVIPHDELCTTIEIFEIACLNTLETSNGIDEDILAFAEKNILHDGEFCVVKIKGDGSGLGLIVDTFIAYLGWIDEDEVISTKTFLFDDYIPNTIISAKEFLIINKTKLNLNNDEIAEIIDKYVTLYLKYMSKKKRY